MLVTSLPTWSVGGRLFDVQAAASDAFLAGHVGVFERSRIVVWVQSLVIQRLNGQRQRPGPTSGTVRAATFRDQRHRGTDVLTIPQSGDLAASSFAATSPFLASSILVDTVSTFTFFSNLFLLFSSLVIHSNFQVSFSCLVLFFGGF